MSASSSSADIALTSDGHLTKRIIRAAEATAATPLRSCRVKCHYVASLPNGTVFDSSRARNEVYEFELGAHKVIKGWEIGVASMRVGELALLTIGPDYAYGDDAPPDSPIPKGATLHFEVELIAFDPRRDVSELKDKSLLLRTLNPDELPLDSHASAEPADPTADPTTKMRKPLTDDAVAVTYELRALLPDGSERVLEAERQVQFCMGEEGVPPALEQALAQMRVRERAVVDVARGIAASKLRSPPPNEYRFFDALPAEWSEAERAIAAQRAELDEAEKHVHRRPHWVRAYDENDIAARMYVTLHSITPQPYGWDLSAEAQLDEARAAKTRGAALFAQDRFKQAKHKFKRALSLITEQRHADEAQRAQAQEIALSCHLNMAACALKTKDYSGVLEASDHALKVDPDNVKALYRRAQALIQLHRWDEADELLLAAVRLEPSNKAVRDEIQQMKVRRQEQAVKERTIFSSMFEKIADQEANERKQRLGRAAQERAQLPK